ncbi:MAG: AMP-binding protein [Rikenellaceae bacterium]
MVINTLKDLALRSVEKFSDNVAFSMLNGESVTYNEFRVRMTVVQDLLQNAGLNSGDKVALLSSNMPNWSVCYFAVVSAGMTIVPILPDFSGPELDMIIQHSEAKAILVSDKLFTRLSKETISKLNVVIRTKNLSVISQKVEEKGSFTDPKSEDIAAIIYTSGTTSKPKGVMLSHYNLVRQVEVLDSLFLMNADDVCLSVLPLSHTYECSLGMILPFSKGGQSVYLDRPPTATVLMPALKRVRPTIMLIVPLLIEKIFRSQVQAKFNSTAFLRTICKATFIRNIFYKVAGNRLMKVFGGRVRFLGVGGAKLDINTEEFLAVSKFPYAIGYGLTETAPVLAGAIPGKTRLGSTGPMAKGLKVRLENINPETGQGEVVVKTPCAMVGYYKNPEATKEVFTEDGWFRTGDLGELDKDGYLYIKGRLKNMILGPSGENIYPEEIESVLNSHVYISDSVVTEQEGRLVALVHFNTVEIENLFKEWRDEFRDSWESRMSEWEARKDAMKKEIQSYVNSKVNRFSKISEVVEQEEEFVKTPTHKIKRFLYNKSGKGNNGAADAKNA